MYNRVKLCVLLVVASSVLAAGLPVSNEDTKALEGLVTFRIGKEDAPLAKGGINANLPDVLSMDSHEPFIANASVMVSRDSAMQYFTNVPVSFTCVLDRLLKLPMTLFQQFVHSENATPVSEPCFSQ